jgi:hypothetical protein
MINTHKSMTSWRRGRTSLAVAAVLLAAACSDSLVVENPDILPPDALEGAAAIPTIYAGIIGDFSFAVVGDAGGSEGIISVTASISDELGNSETFPTRKEYDIRTMLDNNGTLTGIFRNLHRARRSAERGAEQIKAAAPNLATETRIAEAYNLAGTLYNYFAEAYCSGVPISDADPVSGELEFGPSLSTAQLIQKAIDFADSATKYSVNSAQTNFARIVKARALMNQGKAQFGAAAALVAGVATTFRYVTTHTNAQSRQWNGVNAFINQFERFSLVNDDGTNGIAFMAASDPRIPWARTPANDFGFDGSTPQFDQGVYPTETASLPIASGVEARLIEAEAALNAGDAGTWLTKLNELRATTTLYPPTAGTVYPAFPALAPLTDPGDALAREDLMFRERAFWLFLTGHRQGDLRRLIKHYGRTEANTFPGGGGKPYIINGNNKGGNYGNDVAIPIPLEETNNPNYTPNYPACKAIA